MFQKLQKHEDLMKGMFDRTGVNPPEVVERGDASPTFYRESLMRCCLCGKTDECAAFLEETEGRQASAPDYCRNKHLLDRLQKSA